MKETVSIDKLRRYFEDALLPEAEAMFGPRSPGGVLLGIEFRQVRKQALHIWGSQMKIILTPAAAQEWAEATIQCAHETVHFLSALREGRPNVLEEGVATMFQAIEASKYGRGLQLPYPGEGYDRAWTLASELWKADREALKNLRCLQPVFSLITLEQLSQVVPCSIAEELVSTFRDPEDEEPEGE